MKDNLENENENTEYKNKLGCCECLPIQRFKDLNAGSGSAGPFTVTTGTVFTLPAPVNIASVSVDVGDLLTDPCFSRKPRVLLTFIAGIGINDLSLSTTLNFYIVRSSCNSTVILGPVSQLAVTTFPTFPFNVGHAFKYLDKDIEPGNYTYSVQLASGSTVTGLAGVLGASVIIQSATLGAIAAAI